MHSPPILALGIALGLLAGYIYGRIGMELLAREDQAKGSDKPQPGLKDYMLGWVLPIVLGFAAFIIGFIGYSGVPTDDSAAAEGMGNALTNRGLAVVLIAYVVGLSMGRLPSVLGGKK